MSYISLQEDIDNRRLANGAMQTGEYSFNNDGAEAEVGDPIVAGPTLARARGRRHPLAR
jgi:hypothetical protein